MEDAPNALVKCAATGHRRIAIAISWKRCVGHGTPTSADHCGGQDSVEIMLGIRGVRQAARLPCTRTRGKKPLHDEATLTVVTCVSGNAGTTSATVPLDGNSSPRCSEISRRSALEVGF